MEKRQLPTTRIIVSFIIANLIFISIFLIGYMVSYSKYTAISSAQENIRYNLLSIDLEKKLIASSCNMFDPYYISQELENMGGLIGILEERFGKGDGKVIKQKEMYSMLEIQHFILINEHNQVCNKNIPTILFFYSNEENFINSAEKTGFILSSLKEENKNIMIYSFDYNLPNNLIKILKNKYNVTQPNTVIINENIKITEINNINDIIGHFK